MKKQLLSLISVGMLTLTLLFSGIKTPIVSADGADVENIIVVPTVGEVVAVAEGIVEWKKKDVGSDPDGFLINDEFLSLAGSTPGDWYPIGLGRLGIKDNSEGYLAVINDVVDKRYSTPVKLDKAKATEWHRISLAILACGGNPRKAGFHGNVDLIADGTFNRVDESGGILGKQGINGFIWGLIALDTMCYAIPDDAFYTRDDIILNILSREIDGGGWALTGDIPDPDITAMAIQSLVPYYNSEKEYVCKKGTTVFTTKVRDSVKRALKKLSSLQQTDGGFISWGAPNSESAVQVLIALCLLGKSPFDTNEFIKDGKTVYDGIMKYRNADGGFLHSYVYDEENPSSLPDTSNTMAGEQALYGMASLKRFMNGERRLYDFRTEQSIETKRLISEVMSRIELLSYQTESTEVQRVYEKYLEIEPAERSYVFNYEKLSEILEFKEIPYAEEVIDYNSGVAGDAEPMYEFTSTDIAKVDALPERITMASRAEVLKLLAKIRNSFDFPEKSRYYAKLEKAKNEIDKLEEEIESIKRLIKEELYPFNKISLKDKKTVYELYERYTALSEYDRTLFEKSDIEGLMKSKTQIDNLQTALIISSVVCVMIVGLVVFIVIHVRKRKKEKLAMAMPESEE